MQFVLNGEEYTINEDCIKDIQEKIVWGIYEKYRELDILKKTSAKTMARTMLYNFEDTLRNAGKGELALLMRPEKHEDPVWKLLTVFQANINEYLQGVTVKAFESNGTINNLFAQYTQSPDLEPVQRKPIPLRKSRKKMDEYIPEISS